MKLCLGMTVLDPERGVGVIKEIDPYHKRRFLVKFDKHPRLYSYSNKGVCRSRGSKLSEVSIVNKDYKEEAMKLYVGMKVECEAFGKGVVEGIPLSSMFAVCFNNGRRWSYYENGESVHSSESKFVVREVKGKKLLPKVEVDDKDNKNWIKFDLRNLPEGLDLFLPPNAQPNIDIRWVCETISIADCKETDCDSWSKLIDLISRSSMSQYYWRKKVVKLQRTHEEIMSNWFLLDIRVPEFQGKLWSRIASYNPEANKYRIPYILWVGKDYFTDLKMRECPNE